MTLQDFFKLLSDNPAWILTFFSLIPFTAFLAGILGKGEGHLSPWRYLYSTLIYLVSVPGIFAITLNIYLFIFERRSIMSTDVYTQILPILSMVVTLLLIKKNTALENIPGFDKLSGLVIMIAAVFAILWIIEKTHIIAITFIPFHYVILLFAVLLFLVRLGWVQLFRSEQGK